MASSADLAAQAGQADVPDPEEVRAQLARILASAEFRSAKNRARFLEYVVVRTLEGASDRLKEYTIGVEVFDRGADFDPSADGVVRTQAGLVRKYLERYYATEGVHDPVEIALPKGHYLPRFQRRAATAALPPSPSFWSNRRFVLASLLSLVLVAAVAAAFLRGFAGAGPARASALALDVAGPLWGPFLQPGASNVLAFGIPQFFTVAGGIWVRDVEVNAPTLPPRSDRLQAIAREVGPLHAAEAYTGVGEAYGVHLLTRFFLGGGRDLRVVRSPSVSWETLKHDNVIFLTSARFKTLADRLSYPTEFVHVLGTPNRVRNLHPRAGEQEDYVAVGGEDLLVDHAIVSVWPGKLPGRRILVLSGSHTWGTQAAAEYVTEPAYLRDLNERLLACKRQNGAEHHAPFFQVLLRVDGRDNQPIGAKFVTHRDLALDETGAPLVANGNGSGSPRR